MSEHSPLRSFGRLKSRPIKPRQAALVESLLPQVRCPQLPVPTGDQLGRQHRVNARVHVGGVEADIHGVRAEPNWVDTGIK